MFAAGFGLVVEIGFFASALLLTGGLLALYIGWNQRRRASLVTETSRTAIGDVPEPGRIRVRGTITPEMHGAAFRSPIRDDPECVLSAWEIEEKYRTGKTTSWERAAWGVRSVPFYVEDDTGRVLVDPGTHVVGNGTDDVFTPESVLASNGVSVDGLRCEFDAFDVAVETDYGEDPPAHVTHFLETTDGVGVDPMAFGADESKRRYSEQVLESGETVSVLGTARPRNASVESREFVVEPGAETTYLSTARFDELSDGGGNLVLGTLLTAIGCVVLGASLFFGL